MAPGPSYLPGRVCMEIGGGSSNWGVGTIGAKEKSIHEFFFSFFLGRGGGVFPSAVFGWLVKDGSSQNIHLFLLGGRGLGLGLGKMLSELVPAS